MVFGFLAPLVSVVAPVAGVIGGMFGFRKTQRKIEGAAGGIQTSIDTTLKNVHQELVMFREKLETDFIPEAKETMLVARDSMNSLVHTVHDTSVVAQESMRGFADISRAFMNRRTFITMDRVDVLTLLYVIISAYMLFERDLMRMFRVACMMSCLALAGKLPV